MKMVRKIRLANLTRFFMNALGQLMLFGIEGTKVTSEIKTLLKETGLGGIILFKRNYENPSQLRRFIADLQDASETPLIIGIDQEGGRVARLGVPFTCIPSMARVGVAALDDPELVLNIGRILGKELAAVGINLDFAPVLDVGTNAANPVIGDRSFSPDPYVVARFGSEFVRGLQGEGVAACGKHFPGHGDTDVDSHLGLPLLHHTRRRFDVCELVPFRSAIAQGIASIMTAHLFIPNLDYEAPATISRLITTGILRNEFGFSGLVFTDCLTMEGIANIYPPAESAWRAIAAGADVAIVCHDREKQYSALEGLRRAVGEGFVSVETLAQAFARVSRFKESFCAINCERPPMSVIGCREHKKIASEVYCKLG